jgi:hypothetical protein
LQKGSSSFDNPELARDDRNATAAVRISASFLP